MNPTRLLGFLSLAVIFHFVSADCAQGQSLWQKRARNRENIFRDVKARKTGDLLTVLVNIKSDVKNENRRQMNKTTAADASGDTGFSGSAGAGSLQANYKTDSKRNFSGNSSVSLANNFSDQFTVAVLDVQPNGNLIIGGKRRILVEGDERTIILTGIVRAVDIQHNNSIQSQHVANLSVQYAEQGQTKSFTRQGWLLRKINDVWPF